MMRLLPEQILYKISRKIPYPSKMILPDERPLPEVNKVTGYKYDLSTTRY